MSSRLFRLQLFSTSFALSCLFFISATWGQSDQQKVAEKPKSAEKQTADASKKTAQEKEQAGNSKKASASKAKPKQKAAAKPKAKKKVPPSLPQAAADTVTWRSIGPANMSGRITAIAVYEKDPCIWWAATASGGLLKTVNNGVNFEHQFDDQATVSIGDVQVSQSNPDIVWVGTGESNPRNSVSWGDGVYKSTDGGKTWKNMGLKKIFQTGALAIHPKDPDTVWVGALGRLWGSNPERGLFKTIDGGKTWKKVLYVNDKTGVIDVQVNPKNPDEMLVATYERKRDGFDGNDPMQRFGDGAGIYKSVDGGQSFSRVSEGLPTCKLGRIGLDYFESDPSIVVAVVESEKIGKVPENYSFAGLRGEDAEVGAKITRVTKDGPADKGGMKDDDIVVQVDGRIVPTYREFLKEYHKKIAGETVKLTVMRDKKLVDLEIKLDKKPKSTSTRTQRTELTGTLGGQAGNLQDTQGPDGHEFGGIYLSEDGGSTWSRINSLNPRPMYYSNIQIDPVDRNNIFLCGTSLYKSSDGGKTFTNDGGSDGIHVDHHALWIDAKDPRHMILGNDGGVHVTYDRMTHWDHIANVAIGQFYHVGVDSNLDYNVYGGLQDNGSWGGPSRTSGSGPVNSDWFRVGGGDGFITLVDPEDSNQIYFESQNGAMGRIHLETGARGFIRPRSERGQPRPRFNWKTPFILSPHNSKVHYSAGNRVYRSFKKGDGQRPISPDLTNSDKGAGSAITESPMEPGVLYVGTTDGAVWMTKNGGSEWEPLFYSPMEKEKPKASEEEKDKKAEKPDAKDEKSKPEGQGESEKDSDSDGVTGQWAGKMISDRIPEDRAAMSFKLKLEEGGKLTGTFEGRQGAVDISDGKYDSDSGAFSFLVEGGRGEREFSGTIKEGKLTGEMSAGGGRFEVPIEATLSKDPQTSGADEGRSRNPFAALLSEAMGSGSLSGVTTKIQFNGNKVQDDDLTGDWIGAIENENLPGGRVEFTIELKQKGSELTGRIVSPQGELDIVEGVYNAEKKRAVISAENDDISLEIQASVSGSEMNGNLSINDGMIEADFTGKRKVDPNAASEEAEKAESASKTESENEGVAKAEGGKEKKAAKQETEFDDEVSGKYEGKLTSANFEQDVSIIVKRKSDKEITGTFESQNGQREISSGSFNPETKKLDLVIDSDRFQMKFSGELKETAYAGDLDINDGQRTMEFSFEKTGGVPVGEKKTEEKDSSQNAKEAMAKRSPTGDKSLSKWLPGPRWISSLEASRFKKERCYITVDGHRSNDDGVYVFVTNDYGQTWDSLTENLPDSAGSARVLREDLVNENLLFLGCEFSSWYSIDAGTTWTRIKGGLPTVAVHEFAIHPKANEVVAGTHGRSLWIADISTLRQLSKATIGESSKLYKPKNVIRWQSKPLKGSSGTRKFVGSNPNRGAAISYSLGRTARAIELEVFDLEGQVVKRFEELPRSKGVHVLQWDLRRNGGRQSIRSGDYLIKMRVDGENHQEKLVVQNDPSVSEAARTEIEKGINQANSAGDSGDDN